MADVVNNTEVLEATSHGQLNGNTSVVTAIMSSSDTIHEQRQQENTDEDILQQALVEASESFEIPCSSAIQYGQESIPLTEGTLITTEEEEVKFLTSNGQVSAVQLTEGFENGNIDILPEVQSETNGASYETEPNAEQLQGPLQVSNENGLEYVLQEEGENLIKEDETNINITQVIDPGGGEQQKTGNVDQQQTILLQQPHGPAPLGSSQNPIRIIQQGNQYTPVQQLTTEQLQQIMQVVQQQQVASKSVDTGSSVLFNPQTNTRIVYRVIYPSELHKEDPANKQNTTMQTTPKKIYKKRAKDDETDKIDGPELSREEKESRKRMRAKTRSGRISKPPKHMVKDFKHIHVLDYDEDYDDSDGGYSDYKVEDGEEDDRDQAKQDDDDGNFIAHGEVDVVERDLVASERHQVVGIGYKAGDRSGISCTTGQTAKHVGLQLRPARTTGKGLHSMKPKNWKCITCDKAYIGRAGLGRHLKLYPSHGTLDPDSEEMEPAAPSEQTTPSSQPDESTTAPGNDASSTPNELPTTPNDTTPTTQPATPNGLNSTTNSTASFSEDSRDSSYSLPYTPVSTTHTRGQRGRPRGSRRGWRGRGNYYRGDPETRRRNRLKELMKECSDEELMEVVLPRLAKVITLWEFLLMKVEKGDPAWPHADDIFREYEKLHQHVRKLCQEYLLHVPEVTEKEVDVRMIQVTDSAIATGLGLKLGHHRVTDIPDGDTDLKYKHKPVAANHISPDNSRAAVKRTLEVVSPEPIASPAKKPRLVSLKQNVTLAPVQNNTVAMATVVPNASVTNTGVLLNHSASHSPVLVQGPSMSEPQLQLISAPGTVNRTIGASVTTGKSSHMVPGRTKSLVKLSPPSTSSQTKPPSQKFIIISGTDANATSTNTKINAKVPGRNVAGMPGTVQIRNNIDTGTRHILPAPPASQLNQIITISNDQNEISQLNSLQSATNVGLTSQQVLPINSLSNQQFIVVSQSSPGQTIDEKLLIGGTGSLKPVAGQNVIYTTSQAQPSAPPPQVLNNSAMLTPVAVGSDTRFLTTGANSCDVGEIKFEAGAAQNVVYTFQNGDDGLIAESSAEPMDTSQNSVLYSIGSSGMVSLLKPGPNPAELGGVGSTVARSRSGTQVILSNDNANEVVGVINSIDNGELQHVKLEAAGSQLDVHSEVTNIHVDVTNTNLPDVGGKSDSLQLGNGLDTNVNTGLDANVNNGLDTNVETGLDANVNSGLDANVNSDLDTNVNSDLDTNVNNGLDTNPNSGFEATDGNTVSAVSSEHVKDDVNDAMQVDSDTMVDQSPMAAVVNGSGDVVLNNGENNSVAVSVAGDASVAVSVAGDASLITDKGGVASANVTYGENVPANIVKNNATSVVVNTNEECSGETTSQVEGGEVGETIQVPAISIFQTEDGVIFIQNPDGSTLQLQSPDGQNISMETVQALLAMDGETQFITEQTAVENQ